MKGLNQRHAYKKWAMERGVLRPLSATEMKDLKNICVHNDVFIAVHTGKSGDVVYFDDAMLGVMQIYDERSIRFSYYVTDDEHTQFDYINIQYDLEEFSNMGWMLYLITPFIRDDNMDKELGRYILDKDVKLQNRLTFDDVDVSATRKRFTLTIGDARMIIDIMNRKDMTLNFHFEEIEYKVPFVGGGKIHVSDESEPLYRYTAGDEYIALYKFEKIYIVLMQSDTYSTFAEEIPALYQYTDPDEAWMFVLDKVADIRNRVENGDGE